MIAAKLSILICSVPSRVQSFEVLQNLIMQAKKFQDVEIIYLGDNWRMSIGKKRNKLIAISEGEYIVFIDDDDEISGDYVYCIRDAIKHQTDVIVFGVEISMEGGPWLPVEFDKSFEGNRNFPEYFERMPNHLMCWRRDVVKNVKFPHTNMGEDSMWAHSLRKIVKTQHRIDKTLYYYKHVKSESESLKRNHSKR